MKFCNCSCSCRAWSAFCCHLYNCNTIIVSCSESCGVACGRWSGQTHGLKVWSHEDNLDGAKMIKHGIRPKYHLTWCMLSQQSHASLPRPDPSLTHACSVLDPTLAMDTHGNCHTHLLWHFLLPRNGTTLTQCLHTCMAKPRRMVSCSSCIKSSHQHMLLPIN